MDRKVWLQPMTAEMYHAYFREYQNDPDLPYGKCEIIPDGIVKFSAYAESEIKFAQSCAKHISHAKRISHRTSDISLARKGKFH